MQCEMYLYLIEEMLCSKLLLYQLTSVAAHFLRSEARIGLNDLAVL